MQVLYVHQNFPAQFGHLAQRLHRDLGWKCVFVTQGESGTSDGIERIGYKLAGGATAQTHFCSRTFENAVWHCDAIYEALRYRTDVRPDLIVGHSGFGSTLFLRELYPKVPVVSLFEYYYNPHEADDDMDFRKDLGWAADARKYNRARGRNAMILLDLQNCRLGYCPTEFQRGRFPAEYQPKLRTIFDGIDRTIYHGHEERLRKPETARKVAGIEIPAGTRLVTYVSRGLESMRGFDIFMRAAKLIYQQIPNVHFVVVGEDRVVYGGDTDYLGAHKTFRQWTLAREKYDLSKFTFAGRLPPGELAALLAATDLHIYLTVPFVLSWSMMDAMSCGAVVLGSSTSPVREMIQDGVNGLLADFFSPEEFAQKAVQALKDPAAARALGRAAEQTIAEKYSLDAIMPQMTKLYEEAAGQAKP